MRSLFFCVSKWSEGIFELLNRAEAQEISLPQYICLSYLDMPSNDLSSISSMILSLKDEIEGLKTEIGKFKSPQPAVVNHQDRVFTELSVISRNIATIMKDKSNEQILPEEPRKSNRLDRAKSPVSGNKSIVKVIKSRAAGGNNSSEGLGNDAEI